MATKKRKAKPKSKNTLADVRRVLIRLYNEVVNTRMKVEDLARRFEMAKLDATKEFGQASTVIWRDPEGPPQTEDRRE